MVGGRYGAEVVRQVDNGPEAVEREVATRLVPPEERDQAVGAIVVLGDLVARVVVLEQQRRLVVDVLPEPFLADLLGASSLAVVLEAAQDGYARDRLDHLVPDVVAVLGGDRGRA